jgi:hypothetical protein
MNGAQDGSAVEVAVELLDTIKQHQNCFAEPACDQASLIAIAAALTRAVPQDELVAALKDAERAIDDCQSWRSHLHHKELATVRAAIAKAQPVLLSEIDAHKAALDRMKNRKEWSDNESVAVIGDFYDQDESADIIHALRTEITRLQAALTQRDQAARVNPTERFEWQPIEVAPREAGVEILGVRIAGDKMLREPFISFWSPTLNKFYCDPTHYILMPRLAAAIRSQPPAGGSHDPH